MTVLGTALLLAYPAALPPAVVPPPGLLPLVGPVAGPALVAPQGTEETIPPIQEQGDFYILNFSQASSIDDQLSLEKFVSACQAATGLNFTYMGETRQQLSTKQVFLSGTKRIPKADFYRFFQIMMFINEFVCIEVGPPHISVILVQSISQGAAARTNIKQKTLYILPEELEDYADQPATLITTVLNLPNTEVRALTTSLRGLLTDTNTQNLLAAGDHSVILQGFGSNVASLARLLRIIDDESAIADEALPMFDVVPLEFAAAEDVADLLDQLLEATRRSGAARAAQQTAQGVSGALGGGDAEAKILVDARTNSLHVMAKPDELPRIKELVAQLDVEVVEPERNYHIYNLQNVTAEDIADVLDEFLQDAGRISRSGAAARPGQPGQAATPSSQSGDIVVVPDPGTNSLLIAANKTRYEEVLELVRQLDRRQDQVLIETALIALQGSKFRDLGVELATADVVDDGGFGVTDFGLSSFIDTDNDNFPDTRVPNVMEGITAGIIDGNNVNLPLLIAAVERTDNTNVLNVPSVLVNNNGSATVTTLDEQPTTTVTATGGVGGQTQENFAGYEDAGVTLSISPSISASRYLRLNIYLQVSNFLGTFQVGAIPPPRITREISTTVNVPDGDTMVIGGIVTDVDSETVRKVPFLGDIPLLGFLFRRTTTDNDVNTLYFFVTPHILRDKDFADLAEISYQTKLKAAEVIGQGRVRVVDPDWGEEAQDKLDLDAFQIPLYRSPSRGEVDPNSVGLDPVRREELLRAARGIKSDDDVDAPVEGPMEVPNPMADDGVESIEPPRPSPEEIPESGAESGTQSGTETGAGAPSPAAEEAAEAPAEQPAGSR